MTCGVKALLTKIISPFKKKDPLSLSQLEERSHRAALKGLKSPRSSDSRSSDETLLFSSRRPSPPNSTSTPYIEIYNPEGATVHNPLYESSSEPDLDLQRRISETLGIPLAIGDGYGDFDGTDGEVDAMQPSHPELSLETTTEYSAEEATVFFNNLMNDLQTSINEIEDRNRPIVPPRHKPHTYEYQDALNQGNLK